MSQGNRGRLRAGVVGCGAVGVIHAEAYLRNPAVEFVGLCDLNEELLHEQASRLRVPRHPCIAELVEEGKPALVSVVVHWSKLVEPVAECLNAGVHVLSEKPISFEAREILSLVRLANSKGLQLGVNFNQRFTPASQWFRELRERGEFGEMLYTLSQYNQGGGESFYALREHMIHQLDFWRYHIGDVASVTAQAWWTEEGRHTENPRGVATTLQFAKGALGVFTNGFPRVGGINNYYELVGTRGRGHCENFVGRALFRPDEGQPQTLEPPWIGRGSSYWDTFETHLELVVEALLDDRPMPVPAIAAFEAQCLCTAIARAIETGTRVEVQPIRQEAIGSARVAVE